MSKRTVFLVFILFLAFPAISTEISGQNKEYAGQKLQFYQFTDPVTQEKSLLFTLEFDENGNFSTTQPVDQTTFVFSDFGIYRGMLFLEPDKKVTILFPRVREKSFADQKNPFFEPVEFWFATSQGNQLNDQISAFDHALNKLTDQFFNQLYFDQSKVAFDSLQANLNQQFGNSESEVFQWHKKLKLKAVETDVFRLSPEKVAKELMTPGPSFWNHPAFVQLFDKLFANKLTFETRSATGNSIRKALASGDLNFFHSFLKEKYGLTSAVADLALLKMLHDGFYSGDFPKNEIVAMISSFQQATGSDKTIPIIAASVLKKLLHLQQGSQAPVVCLENTNGNRVCTDENLSPGEKKYKYLIFADTEMVVCREHLKYLTKIKEQFQKYLDIVIVLRKTDLIEMKMFLEKEKIPGVHLVDSNGEYIEKYRVKSFPTCFFLNENHEVVFPQTRAPLDGFEQQFGAYLRQKLFENQRNQSR